VTLAGGRRSARVGEERGDPRAVHHEASAVGVGPGWAFAVGVVPMCAVS